MCARTSGSPDERVTQSELSDLATMEFNPLNVMILIRKPNRPDRASRASRHRLFGNPDDAFAQSLPKRGLVTHAEVRSIALAQLDIRATSIVWDIGAGLRLGGDRGGPACSSRNGVRDRAGAGRYRADPGQRGGVRRPQRARAARAARPRCWRRFRSPTPFSWGEPAGRSTSC